MNIQPELVQAASRVAVHVARAFLTVLAEEIAKAALRIGRGSAHRQPSDK